MIPFECKWEFFGVDDLGEIGPDEEECSESLATKIKDILINFVVDLVIGDNRVNKEGSVNKEPKCENGSFDFELIFNSVYRLDGVESWASEHGLSFLPIEREKGDDGGLQDHRVYIGHNQDYHVDLLIFCQVNDLVEHDWDVGKAI